MSERLVDLLIKGLTALLFLGPVSVAVLGDRASLGDVLVLIGLFVVMFWVGVAYGRANPKP